jgi:hypothetical protein
MISVRALTEETVLNYNLTYSIFQEYNGIQR